MPLRAIAGGVVGAELIERREVAGHNEPEPDAVRGVEGARLPPPGHHD